MIKNKNTRKLIVFTFTTLFSLSSFAAYNDMHKAVEGNEIKKIEELLKTKPTLLQEFDDNGNTPIHKAIGEDKNASLQAFMKFKKSINTQITNRSGDTPLVFAIKNKKYNSIIFMLDNGINPFYKDRFQKNSLDYVKETGDVTTKQIYNEFYSRNRDKIKGLQESYNQPVDLSLFSKEEQKLGNKKEINKVNTTVQDLLIGNSRAKNLAMIGSAEPEALDDSQPVGVLVQTPKTEKVTVDIDKVKELAEKIEKLKIDQSLLESLQEKNQMLQQENDFLKKKLEFKQATGKEELTPLEENMVKSQYAGIYEQQLIYGDTPSNDEMPNMDDSKVVPDYVDENLPVVGDVIDYKGGSMKTLTNIEQEFPVLSSNINKAIKKEVNSPQVILPIDKIPDNQAVVKPIETPKTEIQSRQEVPADSIIMTPAPDEKKIETVGNLEKTKELVKLPVIENKDQAKKEFKEKMTSDSSVAIILFVLTLGIICFIAYGWISYHEFKNRKPKEVKKEVKTPEDNINIEVTNKDKI